MAATAVHAVPQSRFSQMENADHHYFTVTSSQAADICAFQEYLGQLPGIY